MSQFTIYRSTDASAPVLDGNADATNLIALLDAVLVNGYGSKSAAGWGHPFAGSATKQVYRAGSGNRFYLRLLDDASLTGARRDCGVWAAEAMSDVDTATTNRFPTAAQLTNGVNWRKSTTADATARPWVILADDRTVYIMIQTGDTNATAGIWPLYAFGEYFSYKTSDTHNGVIIGAAVFSATAINFTTAATYSGDLHGTGLQVTLAGHYIAASASGSTSIPAGKKSASHLFGSSGTSNTNVTFAGSLAYPHPADGAVYLHPIWLMDGTSTDVIHGEMRGLFHQCHGAGFFSDDDTISGNPGSGKTYLMKKRTPNAGGILTGVWTFETSNTLRTN